MNAAIAKEKMREAVSRHRAGDLASAAQLYQDVLRAEPRHLPALQALGLLCFQCGQFEDAERIFREGLRHAPEDAVAAYNLGCALQHLKRDADALANFDTALAGKPEHLGALVNRAVVLQNMERNAEAIESCEKALALSPAYPPALINRGNARLALKHYADALVDYETVLAENPDIAEAREGHDIALFGLGRAPRAPAPYLRRLYRNFSTYYENQMLDWLHYCGHDEIRRLADRLWPELRAPLRILDLGCGTGLAGEAFKDLAAGGCLDGVDLSPEMIAGARARAIYTDLAIADVEAALAAPVITSYDLVLAADVLIYLGDLGPFFAGVARRLKPGGFCLVTVESKEGEDWALGPAQRYRHSDSYLRAVIAQSGLRVCAMTDFTLRNEQAVPVPAFAAAMEKIA